MKNRFTCDWIFNILVVLCDGKVVCGCADPRGERPLGHLDDHSLKEIWHSDLVRKIREDLNTGFSPFCQDCGLKRLLELDEEVPQHPVRQDILPRIFLEPTVACNLSCYKSVCSKESGIVQTRSRTRFPLDQFEKVLTEVGPEMIRMDLFNYGESFVHPEIMEMIEMVRRNWPSIYLYISTNGMLMDPDRSRRLVAAGVPEITFSIDGTDQASYSRYRCGGDFDRVMKNLETLVKERDRSGKMEPVINWRYILFKWNDSRRAMNRARKLAARTGVDRLTWEITDHPPDAISLRYQIGTKEWAKIRNETWDTSQISNAIPGKQYQAKIRVPGRGFEVFTGQPLDMSVRVKNTGGALWPAQTEMGRRTVRLGVQLCTVEKAVINRDFARAFLPEEFLKGKQSADVAITIPGVESPGEFWLKFDMVSEGVDWFESVGSPLVWRRFIVRENFSTDVPCRDES